MVAAGAFAGCGAGGDETTTASGSAGTGGAPPGTTSSRSTTTGGTTTGAAGGEVAKGHAIPDVIDAVLTTGDPDKACGSDYVTDSYISAAYGDESGCVNAQTRSSAADSVRIQSVKPAGIDPPTAAAKATPRGGQYDGEQLTIKLVKEGDVWRINSIKSNAPVGP